MDLDQRDSLPLLLGLLAVLLLLALVPGGLGPGLVALLFKLAADAVLLHQVLAALLGLGELRALVLGLVRLLRLLGRHGRSGHATLLLLAAMEGRGQLGNQRERLLHGSHAADAATSCIVSRQW